MKTCRIIPLIIITLLLLLPSTRAEAQNGIAVGVFAEMPKEFKKDLYKMTPGVTLEYRSRKRKNFMGFGISYVSFTPKEEVLTFPLALGLFRTVEISKYTMVNMYLHYVANIEIIDDMLDFNIGINADTYFAGYSFEESSAYDYLANSPLDQKVGITPRVGFSFNPSDLLTLSLEYRYRAYVTYSSTQATISEFMTDNDSGIEMHQGVGLLLVKYF